MMYRFGFGYDVHQFTENRPCIIGGVTFDYSRGLKGHSDADVLLHAICDALLGALALGDIGHFFSDQDKQYQNADSKMFLKACYDKVIAKGYKINNLDTIIVCEAPKIGPLRESIRHVVAQILECDVDQISVKATTEEKMGFTGSGQGIASWAYVSLIKI